MHSGCGGEEELGGVSETHLEGWARELDLAGKIRMNMDDFTKVDIGRGEWDARLTSAANVQTY